MNKKELQQFIIQIAAEAGEYLRHHFYTFKNVIEPDAGGTVTNVELALTDILRRRIARQYPDHDIVFQGDSRQSGAADFLWFIDSLDGSSHFSRNIPIYTVNIALLYRGMVMMGAVNHPQTRQLFFAQKGAGAFLNGIKIHVSSQAELERAFIFVELPEEKFRSQLEGEESFNARMAAFQNIVSRAGQTETFRIGAFGQCLVAAGSFDAYIDLSGTSLGLSQAASTLIVQEADGEIIDLQKPRDGFVQVMATNGKLTQVLKKIIDGVG